MKLIADYFRNYVNFSGRTSRSDYWLTSFYLFLIALPISIFFGVGCYLGMKAIENASSTEDYAAFFAHPITVAGILIMTLFVLATFLPTMSMMVRRLRDAGQSPWWAAVSYGITLLKGFLPFGKPINFIVTVYILILLCKPSKPETTTTENTQDNTTNNTQQS